jgi:hypothetical protein
LALLLCAAACGVLPTDGQAQGPGAAVDAAAVTMIALERNCFGCPDAGVLELRRDGSATYTQQGNARLGSATRTARGTVRPQEFQALARLLVSRGFFAMQDTYQPADVADGSWSIVAAQAGALDKRVFSREGAGPDDLRAIEAAIDAVRASLTLKPTP